MQKVKNNETDNFTIESRGHLVGNRESIKRLITKFNGAEAKSWRKEKNLRGNIPI